MDESQLLDLKEKLGRLGVDFKLPSTSSPRHGDDGPPLPSLAPRGRGSPPPGHRRRDHVSDLLQALDTVEAAVAVQENGGELRGPKAKKKAARRPAPPSRHDAVSRAQAGAAAIPRGGGNGVDVRPGVPRAVRGLPVHEPLTTVMAQFRDAEQAWTHEKVRLRREADSELCRATKVEASLSKAVRMLEHRGVEIQSLKAAIKERGLQLEEAGEKLVGLTEQLSRSHSKTAAAVTGVTRERDELKALLMSTLKRLESVDDMVRRADSSTAAMREKVSSVEAERLAALEEAASAVAEVRALGDDHRKLQWQSRLLERMSEVQLQHNENKSQAIRRLLDKPGQSSAEEAARALGLMLGDDEDDGDDA